MNQDSFDSNEVTTPTDTAPQADGVSRRRLIRAGLSAAPVMAALKSNSVLAGTGTQCVRPSAFASLKNAKFNHSRWDQNNMNCNCVRPQDWCHKNYGCKYHKISDHGLCNQSKVSVKCWSNGRWDHPDFSFHDLFTRVDLSGDHKLARNVAACYANAMQHGDWQSPLTKEECKAIWRTGGDGWTPVSGGHPWTRDDTVKFFGILFGA